jgi:hypothetical protein
VAFERVEAALPEPLVGGDPPDQLGEAAGAQLVDPPLTFGPRLDQAGLAQDPQVTGSVRLAQPGPRHDLTDRPRPRRKQIEDLPSRTVPYSVEDLTLPRAHGHI